MGATGACAGDPPQTAPSSPSYSKPAAGSLPVDSRLLAVADAILAEGEPLKPDAGRRHSTAFIHADDSGRVHAYIFCEPGQCMAVADALLDKGGRTERIQIQEDRPYIKGWIPAIDLRAIAQRGGVRSIKAPDYAFTR